MHQASNHGSDLGEMQANCDTLETSFAAWLQMKPPSTFHDVVETAIYVNDLDSTEHFYQEVLGLEVVIKEAGRHVFFRVGRGSMLLAFLPDASLVGDTLPAHGAHGSVHFALAIDADAYEGWLGYLQARGVAIEQEVDWPGGSKSLYFRDPANNLVELLTPGLWKLASGW